jgi:hypothetical protein
MNRFERLTAPLTLLRPELSITDDNLDLQALAEHLSADGLAHLINADNHKLETMSITEAVLGGFAFYVTVKPEFVAIDIDRADGLTVALGMADKWAKYKPVIVASGQPGRAHVFMRIPNESQRNRIKELAKAHGKGIDIRDDIRPPMAPHRLGLEVALINVPSLSEAMQRLRGTKEASKDVLAEIQHRLQSGWTSKRHAGLYWLASEYIRLGWSKSKYITDVLTHPHGAGAKLTEERTGEPFLIETWDKAYASSNPTEIAKAHRWAINAIIAHPSMIDTIVAILNLAVKSAKTRSLGIGRRELELITIRGGRGLMRDIRKLQRTGWLSIANQPNKRDRFSTEYNLIHPTTDNRNDSLDDRKFLHHTSPERVGGVLTRVVQYLPVLGEAFAHRPALKKAYLTVLASGGITPGELAQTRGDRGGRSTRMLTSDLAKYGVIEKDEHGRWVPIESEDALSKMAEMRGTVDYRDRVVARIRREMTTNLQKRKDWEQKRRNRALVAAATSAMRLQSSTLGNMAAITTPGHDSRSQYQSGFAMSGAKPMLA